MAHEDLIPAAVRQRDLLGYGRSDKPDITYSIPVEVSTITDFMHAVGLQRAVKRCQMAMRMLTSAIR